MNSFAYGFNTFISGFGIFLAVALTIAGMVLLYLKVIPKKHDGTFKNKFLQMVHDYFNFKTLYIETVLKFIFTFVTVAFVAMGIASVINAFLGIFGGIANMVEYGMSFGYLLSSFFTKLLSGIAVLVVGPVAARLVYEGIMLFILLVKNVIEINNKTKNS